MIVPLRFGLMVAPKTILGFPEPQDVLDKIQNALRTLKISSTKYDIACNTLCRTTIIFSLVKISLWDKTQGCWRPGNIFGVSRKKGEQDEKSMF